MRFVASSVFLNGPDAAYGAAEEFSCAVWLAHDRIDEFSPLDGVLVLKCSGKLRTRCATWSRYAQPLTPEHRLGLLTERVHQTSSAETDRESGARNTRRLEAAIGGPIIRDRLFFFTSYEQENARIAHPPSELVGHTTAQHETLSASVNLHRNQPRDC